MASEPELRLRLEGKSFLQASPLRLAQEGSFQFTESSQVWAEHPGSHGHPQRSMGWRASGHLSGMGCGWAIQSLALCHLGFHEPLACLVRPAKPTVVEVARPTPLLPDHAPDCLPVHSQAMNHWDLRGGNSDNSRLQKGHLDTLCVLIRICRAKLSAAPPPTPTCPRTLQSPYTSHFSSSLTSHQTCPLSFPAVTLAPTVHSWVPLPGAPSSDTLVPHLGSQSLLVRLHSGISFPKIPCVPLLTLVSSPFLLQGPWPFCSHCYPLTTEALTCPGAGAPQREDHSWLTTLAPAPANMGSNGDHPQG